MRKCKDSGDDPYLALLTLRNTPQQHHETSPAQRLLNRRTKTRLPTHAKLMKSQINKQTAQRVQKAKEIQRKYYDRSSKNLNPLKNRDSVRMQPIKLGEKKWKKDRPRCPKSRDSVVRSRMPRIQICSEQKIPATRSTNGNVYG